MEPGFYLTILVFAVAALHLVAQGIDAYRRSGKTAIKAKPITPAKRSDWYMFFHCSALTGETKEKAVASEQNRDISTNKGASKVKDSRPSLRSNLA